MITILENCTIFDGVSADLAEGASVVVENGFIKEVSERPTSTLSGNRVDCRSGFLMPGLIDAHFHAYTPGFDLHGLEAMPMSLLAQHAAALLEGALQRGFTTVRDAGGGDIGLAMAIEKGLIKGPRFFFSGRAISQTGGHGDLRPAGHVEPCACATSGRLSVVVDGAAEMRRAVREELRNGATQVKIFVSGGVVSPTDPIWMPQYTAEEITAAVEEAATRRTYVMAHCHTDERARVCVEHGVRSIEHGTEISEATATLLAASNAYVVPTLSIIAVLRDHGKRMGLPPMSVEKIEGLYDRALQSLSHCVSAGVKIGLGTDLLGHFHERQGDEFQLRGAVSQPIDILRSATSVNAEILQMQGRLGCVQPGAYADLLLVDGNPLMNLALLADSARCIKLILRNGEFIRNSL